MVNAETEEKPAEVAIDSSATKLMTIGGSMFSIPSPIQTAILIEKSGADYNKGYLNDSKLVTTYATNYQKALNLGVYGADVGYVTIYDQSQDALKYMSVINKLSDEQALDDAAANSTSSTVNTNAEDSTVVKVTSLPKVEKVMPAI